MSILLLIDDRDEVAPVLSETVSDCQLEIKVLSSAKSAKLALMEFTPTMLLSRMEFGGDDRAGLKLCQELRDHPSFSEIPVVLFVDQVREEIVMAAKHFGAKAVFPFPVLEMELRRLLSQMLPEFVSPPEVAAKVSQNNNHSPSATVAEKPAVVAEQVVSEPDYGEDNLEYSQRILATILHNLKTSDLLSVVEHEDVPRVVFEMTRTVCEIREEGSRGDPEVSHSSSVIEEEVEDELDLDRAFGLKA